MEQVKTKKRSSPEMEHFFARIQVETCVQMHTRVKLLEGMQMKTILKLLGGIQSNYIPPSPPGFGTPGHNVATKCNINKLAKYLKEAGRLSEFDQ